MTTDIGQDQYRCLSGYIDEDGKLERLPGKRKKKILDTMIEFLGGKFEKNKEYTEMEVNNILYEYHSFNDPATLRRLLFGSNILNRTRDGRRYWLV